MYHTVVYTGKNIVNISLMFAVPAIAVQELVHFSLPAGPTPVTRCYSSETEDTEYTSQPSENGAGVIIA